MPDKRISELDHNATVKLADNIPTESAGQTVRQTNEDLAKFYDNTFVKTHVTDVTVASNVGTNHGRFRVFNNGIIVTGEQSVVISETGIFQQIIGGNTATQVGTGQYWSILGGIGNHDSGDYSLIVGGAHNQVIGIGAVIAGGTGNRSFSNFAFIGGGAGNRVHSNLHGFIGGGMENQAGGALSAIVAGSNNYVTGTSAAIVAGSTNRIETSNSSFIGAGGQNKIYNGGHNVVAGGRRNEIWGQFNTIAGGTDNRATGTNSFIGGGNENKTTGEYVSVVGGSLNRAVRDYSFIGGGLNNLASGIASTVVGGFVNQTTGESTFIGGGESNYVTGARSVVVGGYWNRVTASGGFIGAGENNVVIGNHSVILGGRDHYVRSINSVIGGGRLNWLGENLTDNSNTIAGGLSNIAAKTAATVGGGELNRAWANYATVIGGYSGTATGLYSTVLGGRENIASGSYSIAAGYKAQVGHSGAVVFADQRNTAKYSKGDDTFTFHFQNGVYVSGGRLTIQPEIGLPVIGGDNQYRTPGVPGTFAQDKNGHLFLCTGIDPDNVNTSLWGIISTDPTINGTSAEDGDEGVFSNVAATIVPWEAGNSLEITDTFRSWQYAPQTITLNDPGTYLVTAVTQVLNKQYCADPNPSPLTEYKISGEMYLAEGGLPDGQDGFALSVTGRFHAYNSTADQVVLQSVIEVEEGSPITVYLRARIAPSAHTSDHVTLWQPGSSFSYIKIV